jgi:citrate synthase
MALAERGIKFVPGFGHRFHPIDPRAPRLLEVVEAAAAGGVVGGRFAAIGRAVEAALAHRKGGKRIPMNIDGATAVIYAELGFPPPLCRGLFVLSRSVGALAHAWEQMQEGQRNKGPIPRRYLWRYGGAEPRPVPQAEPSGG